MSGLVEKVKALVLRASREGSVLVPRAVDTRPYEAHFFKRMREWEESAHKKPAAMQRTLTTMVDNGGLATLVGIASEQLSTVATAFEQPVEALVRGVIDLWLEVEPIWTSPTLLAMLRRALVQVQNALNESTPSEHETNQYALELKLLRASGSRAVLTRAGRTLLDLSGKHALSFLLALELTFSVGEQDTEFLSRAHAEYVLQHPQDSFSFEHHDPEEEEPSKYPYANPVIWRLDRLGVVRAQMDGSGPDWDPSPDGWSYQLTDAGRECLQALVTREFDPFMVSAQRIHNELTGEVLGAIAPSAQKDFVRVEEAVQQHAQMVAHELGNKIATMRMRLSALASLVSSPSSPVETVQRELTALENTLNGLSAFNEKQAGIAGAAAIGNPIFSLTSLVDEALSVARGELNGRLNVNVPEKTPSLWGNINALSVALVEVLRNAASFTKPSGQIVLSAAVDTISHWVHVTVEDDGPGIPPHERSRMFEDGFSSRGMGRGHGLAYAKRLAEEQGGTLMYFTSSLGGAGLRLSIKTAGAMT